MADRTDPAQDHDAKTAAVLDLVDDLTRYFPQTYALLDALRGAEMYDAGHGDSGLRTAYCLELAQEQAERLYACTAKLMAHAAAAYGVSTSEHLTDRDLADFFFPTGRR